MTKTDAPAPQLFAPTPAYPWWRVWLGRDWLREPDPQRPGKGCKALFTTRAAAVAALREKGFARGDA